MGTVSDENGTPRCRRAKSVSRAEDIQKQEAKVRRSQPDKPCHRPRDSLFSWSSGFDNFTGFVNWAFLILTVGGIRLLLENLIKYGIRVDPHQWLIVLTGQQEGGAEHPSIVLLLYSIVPVVLCLLIEKGMAVEIIAHAPGMFAHIVNLLVMVLIPMVVIHLKNTAFSLFGASMVCFTYSVMFLKLWSYVQVNYWCRGSRLEASSRTHVRRQSLSNHNLAGTANGSASRDEMETKLVQYPDNLNLADVLYFMCAPTLCYELNFPRTNRIRKRFLMKRLLEVVVGFQVFMCLFQQWIIPSVKNSLIPFSNMDIAKVTERLLKLAIPNHFIWLIWFYLVFHSFLNLIGELMHFADRNFYCDWWNANNIDIFWRSWNMPVHRWAVRHLYIPLVGQGYSKTLASTLVFFISAFFHEYLVSVPLRTFKIWAFTGMMGQIPLSYVSRMMEKKFGPRWGNIVVWSSLIIGQPLCIMMYYHDYVMMHMGEELLEIYGRT
ncbi:diacylglycerol O-acyltransferase 1 isoform X2 [Bacillus rossius redtenbacheri]|uniref:diacylglycerol O-acyltransferase 1 isoform X2 n=1 Tax=Bacillus rossius redtenbacheri TaxID=93214 RepID=UPI002FDEB1CF